MSKKDINTKVLPGFMELNPKDQMVFDEIKERIQAVFKRFGFSNIDTPVIERAEVLLAKAGGETEKQIYEFKKGDNDLALRFDLTVPLARYVAEHQKELTFPFRRYQIAKVYRGEKSQKGRYREFYQCDIDIVGSENLSLNNDAELPAIIYTIFKELEIGDFVIKINNRKLINGLLDELNFQDKSGDIMRAVDKLGKAGKEKIMEMIKDLGVEEGDVKKIFEFLEINGSDEYILEALKNLSITNDTFQNGISELEEVSQNIKKFGVPSENCKIDLAIARGLDYYTGTVYETTLNDYPEIGSVCSGGRYDDLAEKYSNKKFPGVGISIGLTRLYSQLQEAGLIKINLPSPVDVLVLPLVDDIEMAIGAIDELRQSDMTSQIYLEEGKKVSKMLDYANKIEAGYVVLVGEDEIESDKYTVKNMATGEQDEVPTGKLVEYFISKIYR